MVCTTLCDHCTLRKHSLRVRGFNPISGETRRTQYEVVGLSRPYHRPYRLHSLQTDFGIKEVLGLLDCQASVFVGDEVNDGYPLVVRFQPE